MKVSFNVWPTMAILGVALTLLGCKEKTTMDTVDAVDLGRYIGKWHEIARLPFFYEKDAVDGTITATYSYNAEKNYIDVLNKCQKKDGSWSESHGIAFVVDPATNSRLKVSFAPIVKYWGWFAGDYNIIALDPDYQYAMVGGYQHKYLWILSRTATMQPETLDKLKQIATDQGFDLSKLIISQQTADDIS
jgi:apolipoprotein D and lipocalin family protein